MSETLRDIFLYNPQYPLLFTQFYFWAFFTIIYMLFAIIVEVGDKQKEMVQVGQMSRSRMHLRNVFLMAVSWFFYYKTSGAFLLLLAFVTISDWLIAKQIYIERDNWKGKIWLVLSVIIDLGLLAYFKYAYFFTNMFNDIFGVNMQVFDLFAYVGNGFSKSGHFLVDRIILPVGISFYIFQVISYTADIYKGRVKPVRNLLDFGFYVSFFPQLVAGPIVRASEFIPQLYKPFHLSRHQFGIAVFWIINGLAKKIILSDYLAINFIDRVFDNPLLFSGFENLFAIFAYSLQVYADFSGYTDIAIGIALLIGFYLPKNFDSPYKSQNPQEFWHRWHMSLSRWLKTYLYIPLGGNRHASFGTYFWITLISLIALILTGSWIATIIIALIGGTVAIMAIRVPSHRNLLYANLNSFIVMLLGGLWHGASWNFMIWGGLNGIGMILNKFWRVMNWHIRMAVILLLAGGFWIADAIWNLPVLQLFKVWVTILCFGTLIRYSIWFIRRKDEQSWLAMAWAVLQTFAFITFTRLFFRSSSNLDPATANQVAWETAKNMVNQIGSAWDNSVILPFIWEYRYVVTLFLLGMVVHWLPTKFKQWYRINFAMMPLWLMVSLVVIAIVIIYQFVTADMQPFIYFQF